VAVSAGGGATTGGTVPAAVAAVPGSTPQVETVGGTTVSGEVTAAATPVTAAVPEAAQSTVSSAAQTTAAPSTSVPAAAATAAPAPAPAAVGAAQPASAVTPQVLGAQQVRQLPYTGLPAAWALVTITSRWIGLAAGVLGLLLLVRGLNMR
jgi:hypothetical protein